MSIVIAVIIGLVTFIGTAAATSGVVALADASPDASWLDLGRPVLDAIMSGRPALACALALVLAVALMRAYGAKRFPWVAGDVGGTALTFIGSLGAALGVSLAGGGLPSMAMLWTAVQIAAGASGGYTAVRRLIAPALRWIESKVPARVRPIVSLILNVVLRLFEKSPGAVAKAEAAGVAAVVASPGPGIDGVVKSGKSFP